MIMQKKAMVKSAIKKVEKAKVERKIDKAMVKKVVSVAKKRK